MVVAALGAALVMLPAQGGACGVCIEDTIAVTYDHAVVTRALSRRHVVVYTAVAGKGDSEALDRALRRAAKRTRGVDGSSVRTAKQPPALSFALDLDLQTPEAAMAAIQRASDWPGLQLTVLRIVR
jgi:hypothetical protein